MTHSSKIEFLSGAPVGPRRVDLTGTTVWLSGHVKGRDDMSIAREAAIQTAASVSKWLDQLDGHFCLVVSGENCSFAAVDPVRSYPLIWAQTPTGVAATHYGPAMESRMNLGPEQMDPNVLAAVALSGFTIGNATLYRNVTQLGPGEFLWVDETGPSQRQYHRWEPWCQETDADPDNLAQHLSTLNEQLIDDLIAGIDDRPVLVPLSAGLDSRMIASGLKEAGYENVHCVAYGVPGNREAEVSREVAQRLGYTWSFVPYSNAAMGKMFHDPDYARYKSYSDSLTGMHFPQEYRMLTVLRQRGVLTDETVVVNGQSGDFIAGNHIPATLFTPTGTEEERLNLIVNSLIQKHFKHWATLMTPEYFERIGHLLRQSIAGIGVWPVAPHRDHGIYEYIEFHDRQSKYVLNGQRVYEYMKLDWRIPLWDRSYLDFWAKAPLAAKQGESLYRTVLERDNWAGVWKDTPVNPQRIRPNWIRPLRLAAKAMHLPFGRDRWHRFEKRYLDYWMTTTCAYAAWPYRIVAADRRGHYGPSGWHIADYLTSKGVGWNGAI